MKEPRFLLEGAAAASLDRIRKDWESAPEKMKMVFSYLEEHLFEKDLDVSRMKRDCGIADNSFSIFFADVTGQGPHAYIVERRIETAAALLRDTTLRAHDITKSIGFSYGPVLTRNFKNVYGMTPRAFRTGVREIFAKAGCSTTGFPSVRELRIALIRGLESEETRELIFLIKEHNALENEPPSETADQELHDPSVTREESFRIERAWKVLRERPWTDQRDMIKNCLTFATPAFSRSLLKRSIPEGRGNRILGVHLAELALECIKMTEQAIGKDLFQLRAHGWVWLGNARCLAHDFSGAESAFSYAANYLDRENEETLVLGEYYNLKSKLRFCQGRLDEALTLHDRALSIFRAKGAPKDLANSLINGAQIYERAGRDDESIPHLKEAIHLLKDQSEPYLEFAAYFNLTNAYIKTEALENAEKMLPWVYELREKANPGEVSLYHIHWLEGRLSGVLGQFSSAACRYQAARDGFLEVGQNIHAALVSLDFALHCWKHGRLDQVRELTLGVIPLLGAIRFHEEAVAGLKLLQSAIENRALTQAVIKKVKEYLEKVRLDTWT